MKKLENFLSTQGFTAKEVAIYIACLKHGPGTVLQIARKANIKRPTAYLILKELVNKGAVRSFKTKKSIQYSPAHPKTFLTKLKHQMEEVQQLMPLLLEKYKEAPDEQSVAVYEDIETYNSSIVWIREHLINGGELRIFGNIQHFFKATNDNAQSWFTFLTNTTYKVRILIYEYGSVEKEYIAQCKKTHNPNLRVRLIKKPPFPVKTEQAIFGDMVGIFSGGDKFFLTYMHSHTVASTFKAVFEQLWSLGEDVL